MALNLEKLIAICGGEYSHNNDCSWRYGVADIPELRRKSQQIRPLRQLQPNIECGGDGISIGDEILENCLPSDSPRDEWWTAPVIEWRQGQICLYNITRDETNWIDLT